MFLKEPMNRISVGGRSGGICAGKEQGREKRMTVGNLPVEINKLPVLHKMVLGSDELLRSGQNQKSLTTISLEKPFSLQHALHLDLFSTAFVLVDGIKEYEKFT